MDASKDEQQKLMAELSSEVQKLEEEAFLRRQQGGGGILGWFKNCFQVSGDEESDARVKPRGVDEVAGDGRVSAADLAAGKSEATEGTAKPEGPSAEELIKLHGKSSRTRATSAADDEADRQRILREIRQASQQAGSASAANLAGNAGAIASEGGISLGDKLGEAAAYSGFKSKAQTHAARQAYRVPLIQRPWIPYACIAGIVLIWIPDRYKVNTLMWLDDTHEKIKHVVHLQYWKYTMPSDQYVLLLEQLQSNVPKWERVQTSDCPL